MPTGLSHLIWPKRSFAPKYGQFALLAAARFCYAKRPFFSGFIGYSELRCDSPVNAEGVERTECQINDALAKGAAPLCGGKRPDRPELAHGFFYEPTAVTRVRDDMLVLHEETLREV